MIHLSFTRRDYGIYSVTIACEDKRTARAVRKAIDAAIVEDPALAYGFNTVDWVTIGYLTGRKIPFKAMMITVAHDLGHTLVVDD
jgi:hypothetical protein